MILRLKFILLCSVILSSITHAADLVSITWDNDIFVRSDDGYTNGLYGSWFDMGRKSNKAPMPSNLVKPLNWSLSKKTPQSKVNTHTIGHMIVTPKDIESSNPSLEDLPYAGLFFYKNSHNKVYEGYSDRISTTLGVVGPASGAEAMQKGIHNMLDGDDPKGWDHQIKNEVVFQLSRDRTWRVWASEAGNGKTDILVSNEVAVGTLESMVEASVMLRYGSGLRESFIAGTFRSSRVMNPVAVDGGWYMYAGLSTKYSANSIFTNGNTFRDSRSVDINPMQAGVFAGMSYSWEEVSLTFAIEDLTLLEKRHEDYAKFGTLTFAWVI